MTNKKTPSVGRKRTVRRHKCPVCTQSFSKAKDLEQHSKHHRCVVVTQGRYHDKVR